MHRRFSAVFPLGLYRMRIRSRRFLHALSLRSNTKQQKRFNRHELFCNSYLFLTLTIILDDCSYRLIFMYTRKTKYIILAYQKVSKTAKFCCEML